MGNNAEGAPGTGASGAASGNAASGSEAGNLAELEQRLLGRMNEAINKMFSSRLEKAMEAKIEKWVSEAAVPEQQKPAADGGEAGNAPLSMKALQTQIADLQQQLQKRDEAIQQERQRATDLRLRSDVREHLAKVLGADNPNLGLAMDSLYDTRKRFVEDESGGKFVRFKSQYGGEDDLIPMDEGIKRLAENELKHLLPSRTAGLPTVGNATRGGKPLPPSNGKRSPLDDIFTQAALSAETAADPNRQK